MHSATFVLSTGRCGTQWLAASLAKAYGDVLHVEHEPLHDQYRSRQMLAARGSLPDEADTSRRILGHVNAIARHLEARDYVECGHPCWSAIPYLAAQFSGRVRVIHLTRHPVPTALSWITHQAFSPPLLPHIPEKVLLLPHDDGVAFPEYRGLWPTLTPYEKCLYYWAEVNTFGLDQRGRLRIPWLQISYESLFWDEGLSDLLTFLGLPFDDSIASARGTLLDRFRFAALACPDPALVERHPRVVEIAQRLGYDVNGIDPKVLRLRYLRFNQSER